MKAKYDFEIMNLDDELVAVPVGDGSERYHGVLKLNETAAAILKLLAQDTDEEKIVDAILREYAGEKEQIAGYVHEYVERLKAEGIVE
ncbi:MAG: PqqD family protein [Clostridia bacterium]|nr:PqqD family protein [Clostridia bacterium]MBR6186807.1 PqqD family protein [Clostridia bacterium]